jgi:hypothetical protein
MLADPNHTRKFSKQDAILIAEQFLPARGSIVSLKEPCLGCAVIKTFVKIGVGIGHTATGGKFLRRGMKNGSCIDESDTGLPCLAHPTSQISFPPLLPLG